MINRRPKLLFFFFLFLIPMFAISTQAQLYFNDSFDYLGLYTDNSWTTSLGSFPCLAHSNLTVPSIFDTYGLGTNYSNPCGYSHTIWWRKTLPSTITEGHVLFEYDIDFSSSVDGNGNSMYLFLPAPDGFGGGIQFELGEGIENNRDFEVDCTSSGWGCGECDFGDMSGEIDLGTWNGSVLIDIDLDEQTYNYNVLIGGEAYGCSGILADQEFNITYFQYEEWFTVGRFLGNVIDNIVVSNGTTESVQACTFPKIFCDNFDYDTPMTLRDWTIFTGAFSVDNSFSPIENKLVLNTSDGTTHYHAVEPFEMGWLIEEDVTVNSGVYASQFSAEFDLNLTVGEFNYVSQDFRFGLPVYDIKAVVDGDKMDWYTKDSTDTYIQICDNCSNASVSNQIKITSSWAQREKMPFNSTFTNDTVTLYINEQLINITDGFTDPLTQNQNRHYIIKAPTSIYTVDNYYVYVGTDKNTNTLDTTQTVPTEEDYTSVVGSGTGDMADAIGTIWDDMGLRSQTSKTIASLIMMLVLGLTIFSVTLAKGVHMDIRLILLLEFIFMLFLVFIDLLPIWVPIVFIVVGAGIGAIAFSRGTVGD